MSVVLPEVLLWNQSVNSSCGGRMECDTVFELGAPPDMILTIPPPPVPPFMEEFVSRLASEGINIHEGDEKLEVFPEEGRHCNLCRWADSSGVGFVELAQRGPLIDDTWFLVIISSCVGATLLGIILAIAFLKYREGKLKPLSDVALAKKEKALGLERCEAVLYPANSMATTDGRTSRALWAGLKPLEGNHYTVDHCQPMDQKPSRLDLIPSSDSTYDYADYASLGYTSVGSNTLDPNSPTCLTNGFNSHQTPNLPPYGSCDIIQGGQQILLKDPEKSFENVAYVPNDDMEVERIGPDGCVVSRAAYLLGTKTYLPKTALHHYEMVTPRNGNLVPPTACVSSARSSLTQSLTQSLTASLSPRKHKTMERNIIKQTPTISAPTSVSTVHLPPLNSRNYKYHGVNVMPNGTSTLGGSFKYPQHGLYYQGRPVQMHNITQMENGSHSLSKTDNRIEKMRDRRLAQVSLDKTGHPNTYLSPRSSADHIYASPITSPVI